MNNNIYYTSVQISMSESENELGDKPDPSKKLNVFFIICSLVIILSCFISYIFNLRQYNLPKNTYLTGIPFLRTYYFYTNIIVFSFIFVFSIILFYSIFTDNERDKFKQSFLYMSKNLRYFYIIQNLIIYLLFLILYYLVYIPIYEDTKFKLSGHVLITLFSSNIMINLISVIDLYEYHKVYHFILTTLRFLIYILLIHNLYTLIWTCGYFHTFWESILSLIIAVTNLSILNFYSFRIIK